MVGSARGKHPRRRGPRPFDREERAKIRFFEGMPHGELYHMLHHNLDSPRLQLLIQVAHEAKIRGMRWFHHGA